MAQIALSGIKALLQQYKELIGQFALIFRVTFTMGHTGANGLSS